MSTNNNVLLISTNGPITGLTASNGPFSGPRLVMDMYGLYQVADDGCSIPRPRLFDDLFKRNPNGTWVERDTPLPIGERYIQMIESAIWSDRPITIEQERRQQPYFRCSLGFDPMQNYPLGQRPALI